MWHVETDVFALAVFIVLLVRNHKLRTEHTQQDRIYNAILWVSILSVISDIVSSEAMNGSGGWWFYQISLTAYFCLLPALAVMWMCYAFSIISSDDQAKFHREILAAVVPYAVYLGITISNPVTNNIFSLSSDMVYARGPLFLIICVCFSLLYPLAGIVVVLVNHKKIQPKSNICLLTSFYAAAIIAFWIQYYTGLLIICAAYAIVYLTCDLTIEQERRNQLYEKLEKQNQSLAQATAMKSQFFARVSHDMRTPMNGILGLTQLSLDETDPAVLKDNIQKIQGAGKYMLGLINDTLDYQRIEGGSYHLDPKVVSWRLILDSVISMIKETASQKDVGFSVEMINTDQSEYIFVDPMRIKQVLINLLSNAVKFTPAGGSVDMIIDQTGKEGNISHNCFTIQDTGIGISEKFIQEQLYTPFAQESNEFSGQYAGSGLGLSITKSIVERMGGRIEVESKLGKGTTFRVYLDLECRSEEDKQQVHADVPWNVPHDKLKDKKILLCEDNVLNAEIAKRLLEKAGCIVDIACDGAQGVDLYRQADNRYAAVVMDIRMPVMDGLEACRQIRKLDNISRHVPIIAMTANDYEEDVRACLEAGMDAHLAKPIDTKLMYQTLADLV